MDLTTVTPVCLQRLAEALWEEHHAAERLLLRLTCLRLLQTADERRFLLAALEEAATACAALRAADERRVRVVAEFTAARTDVQDLSLVALADATDGPWPQVFADLRVLLVGVVAELRLAHASVGSATGPARAGTHDVAARRRCAGSPTDAAMLRPLVDELGRAAGRDVARRLGPPVPAALTAFLATPAALPAGALRGATSRPVQHHMAQNY